MADIVTPRQIRDVMGHFASGVVVVTGLEGEQPLGFTCQSFVSLSLTPPLISFSPARTSSTWPRLRAIGRFCVNVLAEDQDGLSNRFARSGGNRFDQVDWRPTLSGAPRLDGVCAWIECELETEFDAGDHTIVVGRVTDLGTAADRRPLIFHRGGYGVHARPRKAPFSLGEGDGGWWAS